MGIIPPWCERIQKDQTKTPKGNSSKSGKPPLIADDLQVLCLSNCQQQQHGATRKWVLQLCFLKGSSQIPVSGDRLFVWMDRMDLDMGGIQGSHGRMSHWQYCGVWWMDGIPPLVICIRTNHSSPTNQWSQRSPFFQSSESSVISSVAQFVQPPPEKNSSLIELDYGKNYRKTLYLMVKTMVSCKFSLKPIQWIPELTDFLHRTVSPCRVSSSYHCFGHREGDVVSWVEELVLER